MRVIPRPPPKPPPPPLPRSLALSTRMVRPSNLSKLVSGEVGVNSEAATYSTLFMAAMAASAPASSAKRTKPKPRLRPVSRSLTTTYFVYN